MKTHKWKILIIIPLILAACVNEPNETNVLQLEVSKEKDIKQQEPVYFKLHNNTDADINWKVSPETGVDLKQNGEIASALFSKAGNYTVTGISGGMQVSKNLHVTDSVYVPPFAGPRIEPINKLDKFKVTHTINDSAAAGKPDILVILNFKTTMKYPTQNNYLLTHMTDDKKIEIRGVYVPEIQYQTDETSEASGSYILFPDPGARSNPITIIVNGIEYSGNYYVTNNKLHINWEHSKIIEFTDAVVINQN